MVPTVLRPPGVRLFEHDMSTSGWALPSWKGEVHSSRPVVILGPLSWSARWGKVVVPPIWRATCQKLRSKLLSGIGGGCALCRIILTIYCYVANLYSRILCRARRTAQEPECGRMVHTRTRKTTRRSRLSSYTLRDGRRWRYRTYVSGGKGNVSLGGAEKETERT